MIILDIETYQNYTLFSFFNPEKNKVRHFEYPFDTATIARIMRDNTTISFNGLNFDLPLIKYALDGATPKEIKAACDRIIKSNLPTWRICKDLGIRVPEQWDHIDLIEVAPGQSSLKIYGARLNAPTIQDLPIEPNALITDDQKPLLRDYCENDLRTTWALYKSLEKQVELRVKMSEQYGVDLRSKSDAQIAETVLKSELTRLTGKEYRRPELPDGITFKYQDPKIISFQTPELNAVLATVLKTRFSLGASGAVNLPKELGAKIKIGSSEYQMGIGGLHSCEKSQAVTACDNYALFELDVASYYPSIILQQALAPASMGAPFLKVYQSIVSTRLAAKRAGDKVTADTLKIVVNGSFGKLGSKWSTLFAPDLLIQTTITGQLALLMLIERLELAGISVKSANTDGVVVLCHHSAPLEQIIFDWQLDTSYELERTDYRAIYSRDVNNYIAVTTDGKTKRKGVYGSPGLSKNPDMPIIYDACAAYLAKGVSVGETIRACTDPAKFVTVRKVTGGAVWRGQYLGKAVRFYYSDCIASTECIGYAKNGNKVPNSDGAKPMMALPSTVPADVDYDRYIDLANKQLGLLCAKA